MFDINCRWLDPNPGSCGHKSKLCQQCHNYSLALNLYNANFGVFFIKPHSNPNGFYWGHQCSWTLTPANSMQVSIMQFDNCNRKKPGSKQVTYIAQEVYGGWGSKSGDNILNIWSCYYNVIAKESSCKCFNIKVKLNSLFVQCLKCN